MSTTSHSELLQASLTYASFGWAVFPTHSIRDGKCTCGKPDCSSPGKHPLTRHGFKDATTDPEVIRRWWKRYPWANIAIATGEKSGRLLVIDIDCKPDRGISGEETWREVEQSCPATVEVLTGGGGRHLYFNYLDSVKIKSGAGMIGPGVDVRADGGYVLAPPSLHRSGKCYEWEASSDPLDGIAVVPAPDWVLELCVKPAVETVNRESQVELLAASKVQEIRSALAFIDSDPRDTWLKVGMALKSTNAEQQAYGLWTEWSMQSGKYDPRDQQRTWQSLSINGGVSLSTIFWLAKQNGWVEPGTPDTTNLSKTGEGLSDLSSCIADSVFSQSIEPSDLYNPPGILKTIVDYILQTAYIPQPAYALNAALSLTATVLGRRYCGETKLRTNLYLISVGETGSGKEHPRQVIKAIFDAADCDYLDGGENIASGQALLTRVSISPSILFQLDEFGLMLQSLKQKNPGRHNAEIMINLMKLYTSATTKYKGTEYANQKERPRIDVVFPCVNIHGTTTGETLFAALSSTDIITGYLNRLIVVDTTDMPVKPPRSLVDDIEIPAEIIGWIEEVTRRERVRGNLARMAGYTPTRVSKTQGARQIFDQFRQDVGQRIIASRGTDVASLWQRMWEHADKIATICACAENLDNLAVTEQHARWAIRFVTYHAERLVKLVRDRIADSPFEQALNDFYRAILSAGTRGVTERDMNRYKPFCSHPPKDRRPILETLLKGEKIVLTRVNASGAGRPRIAYVATPNNYEVGNDEQS